MNKFFRVIWCAVRQAYVVTHEKARSFGKPVTSASAAVAVALFMLSPTTLAADLPTGGQIVGGAGSIATSGNTMTVTQATDRMAANWQSFNIGNGNTVNFVQPNSNSVALNRVLGSDVSLIQGALNANGKLFLVNPNGIIFSKDAQVNVGSIVASTLNISTNDFMAGNYRFEGSSSNAIVNEGSIVAHGDGMGGGTVALIAAKIVNEGKQTAHKGNVLMGAGSRVTLNLGGPVSIEVEQGAIDALIEQGGAIKADGGLVYLSAKAAGDLASTVINHTGITEAQTLAMGERGEIYLMGDMEKGRIEVAGTLDASTPNGGDGGFIETSAAKVDIQPGLVVTTKAENGKTGEWLIDPNDYTVAASGGDITGAQLGTNLGNTNVTIRSVDGATDGNGDIFVNDTVTWSSGNTLTLDAIRNIEVSANITHTHASVGGVIFLYGQGSATGDGASYSSTGTVTSPSIQWRKGSAANSLRYAIHGGNYFLGNEYIELGICGPANTSCSSSNNGGKFGARNNPKPSEFFGRQAGLGIGMVGDADGFDVGADLRIDYFLPGSPAEQFSTIFDGQSTLKNFANTANSASFMFEPLDSDGAISLRYSAVQAGTLKVEQLVSLKPGDKFFKNTVTLTNQHSSSLTGVKFARSFDPDNTVDMKGDYETIQTIENTIAAGDSANVVSAVSKDGDSYSTAAGDTAKILYYSTDASTSVGHGGDFFDGASIPSMVAITEDATTGIKGYTQTADDGIGIIYSAGTLAPSASKSFSYLTSLDNRDIATILTDLNAEAGVSGGGSTSSTDSTPEIAAISNAKKLVSDLWTNNPTQSQLDIKSAVTRPLVLNLSLGGLPTSLPVFDFMGGLSFVDMGGSSSQGLGTVGPMVSGPMFSGGTDSMGFMNVFVQGGGFYTPPSVPAFTFIPDFIPNAPSPR